MGANFKVYKRKIDVFVFLPPDNRWHYACSSHSYPTCKAAKAGVAKAYDLPANQVKARFAK